MDNNTLKFKTSIHCGGCLKAVTPFLNQVDGIKAWEVDTESADKILTVDSQSASPEAISEAVKKAGFEISPLA